jgi:probable RcsB/C two-component-system connector, global regulator of biofilm formation and acid-resistance
MDYNHSDSDIWKYNMQMHEENFNPISDRELADYILNVVVDQNEVAAVLGLVMRSLMATEGKVSNEAIILSLVGALESTHDAHQADLLRRTLEIVVGHTPENA